MLLVTLSIVDADPPPGQKRIVKRQAVNLEQIVDSALILADDYATAMAEKPEFARTRLNALKRFYSALFSDSARDSVLSCIYNYYVDYVEGERQQQADAFKNCFLSLAPNTDERLGPLYANELVLARERFDTVTVSSDISRLEAYATRMNYDYDEELDAARRFLHSMRTRKPVRDVLPGVWVSEDIWKERTIDYDYKDFSFKAVLFHPACIANSLAIIKIPRASNVNGEFVAEKCKGLTINVNWGEIAAIGYKMAGIDGFIPVRQEDLKYYHIGQEAEENPVGSINTANLNYHAYSREVKIDDDAYGAYIFWGDEKLKRPNAEISALIRQNVQNNQAIIAGHLSRSQFSTADRMAGNLLTGMAAEVINGFMDCFMVSTDRLFRVETTLQIINPNELRARTYLQVVLSKSNEPEPHVFNFSYESTYYRWDTSDDVAFMGAFKLKKAEVSDQNLGGVLTLTKLSKEQSKAKKLEISNYCKNWKKAYKEKAKAMKVSVKALPKGAEKDLAKKNLKNYGKTCRQCWEEYNEQSYLKLKAKADRYNQENL